MNTFFLDGGQGRLNVSVKGFCHLLGESEMTFFATPQLARKHKGAFPRCN